jgi:hypothetical protein
MTSFFSSTSWKKQKTELAANEYDPSRDRGGRKRLKRKRGTNIVESNNMRGANASVDGMKRLRSSLTRSQKDGSIRAANIAHVIGKPARSRDWFVREALVRQKVGDFVQEEMFPVDEFLPLLIKKSMWSRSARNTESFRICNGKALISKLTTSTCFTRLRWRPALPCRLVVHRPTL